MNNIYSGIRVLSSNGVRYVRRTDIPAGVSYAKRFASRVIASRTGVNSEFVYKNLQVNENRNGTVTYGISSNLLSQNVNSNKTR